MGSVDSFNKNKTRLRVSIISYCNLSCKFCHKEGLIGYTGERIMRLSKFQDIFNAYAKLNGHEVDITGGEPLLHPHLKDILRITGTFPRDVTLSTNGILLNKINLDPEYDRITETKISLHYIDNDKGSKILGRNYDAGLIMNNIKEHINKGYKTIINITLTNDNKDEVPYIIDWAINNGANIKVSDLGETSENTEFFSINYYSPEQVEYLKSLQSTEEKLLAERAGNNLVQHILDGDRYVLIKDVDNGKLTTAMCDDCSKIEICSEGVFAMRVNPNGDLQPCGLRKDLIIANNEEGNDLENMEDAIDLMFGGR